MFRKLSLFSGLALFVLVLGIDRAWSFLPNRQPGTDAVAPVRFTPLAIDAKGFAPFRLVGAWNVDVADPRFGGISSLALNGERLLALTDSGVVVDLPRPGADGTASLRDLPNGPVSPYFKKYRDSEALAAGADGRGWWVAFENRHGLWWYDESFRFVRSRRSLAGDGWPSNRGVEALAVTSGGLLMFPEGGGEVLRMEGGTVEALPLRNDLASPTDAGSMPDGRIIVTVRNVGLSGFRNRLALLEESGDGYRLRPLADLPLGWFDNVEALAIEPRGYGAVRLWLMTDDDFSGWRRTLLIALDWTPKA